MIKNSKKKYPAYRYSGIDWLGDIPEHWEVKRLKYIISERLKYGANEEANDDNPDNPRYIRITDLNSDGTLRQDTFKSLPMELASDYLLSDGDILLARSGATVGKNFIYYGKWGAAAYAGYLIRVRVHKKHSYQYVSYYFNSKSYWDWIESIFIQATIQNVSAEKYANLVIPLPPLDEQKAIADYLDEKTGKIDTLIEKKERLLALLDEKRTSIITQAVTKGLDPKTKLKSSGIDWLGDIPEHWEVKRLRYVSKCNSQSLSEDTDPDLLFDYVDISSISLEKGIVEKQTISFFEAPSRARRMVKCGATIISTVRTYLKAIAYIDNENSDIIVSTGFAVIEPHKNNHPPFISYCLQSKVFISEVVSFSVGVSYPAISSQKLIDISIPLPPLDEQKAIADYLDKETKKIDAMKEKIEEGIEKLREYRTALITAAVTGKIDVRK